jgi:hypothetical protein
MGRMREQLALFQREYAFYKQESEILQARFREECEGLNQIIREQRENEKDYKMKLGELERDNQEL